MSKHSKSSQLLPLPLTAFERYMLADDRVDYPMTFVIEIRLSGSFCFDSFSNANQRALTCHPLLRANVEKRRWQYLWTDCHQNIEIQRVTEVEEIPPGWQSIDLFQAQGLRIRVCERGTQTTVTFLFHHAATDGIGAMRFIGQVLGEYGILTADEGAELPELAEYSDDALFIRGQIWDPNSVPNRSWQRNLKHVFEFLTNLSTGIATERSSEVKICHQQFFVSKQLPRKELLQVKNLANRLAISPNDIYLTCFLMTMKAWNESLGRAVENECYRVLIPASLRTPQHDQLSAANVLSFIMIHSRGKNLKDLQTLLLGMSQRMNNILNSADSRLLTRIFALLCLIPGGLAIAINSPLRFCTGVLANVGEVKRQLNCRFPIRKGKCVAGSVVLESLYGAAPIRKGTALGVSLGTYAGELLINFNCDSKVLPGEQAEKFAELYLSKLNEFVATLNSESEHASWK